MDLVFNDRSDTARKLNNCTGLYDGHPVSILVDANVADVNTIRIKTIPNGRARTIMSDDPLFEARFMPLGYMNLAMECIWLTRAPLRRMQLGVSSENVYAYNLNGAFYNNPFSLQGEAYLDLYNNKYASYVDAVQFVLDHKGVGSRAISREVAMGWRDQGSIQLCYRNVPVGVITPKRKERNPSVHLYDTEFSSFIIARLQHSGIPYVTNT